MEGLAVLSSEEIEKIFDFADSMKNPIALVEIADGLSEIGFPEMKKQIESWKNSNEKLDEITKRRADCIFHCIDISGKVSCNEEGLACPRCGSKYVAWRQFYCFLSSAPMEENEHIARRASHRLEGASNLWNKSYHDCLACGFSFDEVEI